MKNIKEIANELSRGNIEKAAQLRFLILSGDESVELEVLEIARQAIISYLKKGEVEKALETTQHFKIDTDLAHETFKQAILSIYCEGNLPCILKIKDKIVLPKAIREEIIVSCESWGNHRETMAMRALFLV